MIPVAGALVGWLLVGHRAIAVWLEPWTAGPVSSTAGPASNALVPARPWDPAGLPAGGHSGGELSAGHGPDPVTTAVLACRDRPIVGLCVNLTALGRVPRHRCASLRVK